MNNDPAESRRRLEEDRRTLSKWLNGEQTAPIDRQVLARVLAHLKYPPPWIPLTLEEIGGLYRAGFANNTCFAQAVEARLKEKNGY